MEYINYQLSDKTVKRIPKDLIKSNMDILGVTKDEAIQIYLEDEGLLTNEEQEELCKKANDTRITATIHDAKAKNPKKKTQRERTKKDDPTKKEIILKLSDFLNEFATDVKITNDTKLISFTIGKENFKLDLIRQRKTKKSDN